MALEKVRRRGLRCPPPVSIVVFFYLIEFFYFYYYFFNNFLLHSHSLAYAGYITLKQRYVPHIPTNTLAMIPTYGRVLSAIEKALWELMEEY